ncbi:hypothetical protein AA919_004268 [Escherichia coli]|nr:hypothetical protein [Escherichia coli]
MTVRSNNGGASRGSLKAKAKAHGGTPGMIRVYQNRGLLTTDTKARMISIARA